MKDLNDHLFRQAVMEAVCPFQGPLLVYTQRILGGDEAAARDVVQQAFLKLCSIPPESRPTQLNRWLYRVCRNQAIDLLRRNQRLQTGQESAVKQVLDPHNGQHEQLARQELANLVQQHLLTLPDSQREAVDLWSHGFRYGEIAEIMDRQEASIRVLVHRALSKLRQTPIIRHWLDAESEHSPTRPVTS